MSNQFHQLLAVVGDRVQKAAAIMQETVETFRKRVEHFDGFNRTYQPKDAEGDAMPPESKEIVTTVAQKLLYSQKAVISAIDALVSKEETNSSGGVNAELKIGKNSFGVFSATSLLAIEGQLSRLRVVFLSIPTLDPNRKFFLDKQAGDGFFQTKPEDKIRSIKIDTPITLVKATDKHPAQAELVKKDILVGTYSTVYQSGRMTPADKSTLLSRIDQLIGAVKIARAKANQEEHLNIKVGKHIFDFINGEIVK